jgi:hypothetical protein
VSVVIPVYNAATYLEQCLTAIARSTQGPLECIVMDDGSTDDSYKVARRHGATVVALRRNRGPSYARNRGAEVARGEVILFIDADVCIHPETIETVAAVFAREPALAALIGSYDRKPGDPAFLSQYKNLFHHYVHQHGKEEATTFWSGCGAIRRELFLSMGGFNEGYSKACIEDIELGFRLRKAGHHIRLEKQIQVKHLKRWGFTNLVMTDLFFRGVPWVALMVRDRHQIHDLNLNWASRVSTALTGLLVMVLALLVGTGNPGASVPCLSTLALGILCAFLYDRVRRGVWRRVSLVGLGVLAPLITTSCILEPSALLPLGLLLAVLGLHRDFYWFFRRTRGVGFAVGVIPLHLLYFLYSGAAVPLGVLAHARDQWHARRRASGPATFAFPSLASERTASSAAGPVATNSTSGADYADLHETERVDA